MSLGVYIGRPGDFNKTLDCKVLIVEARPDVTRVSGVRSVSFSPSSFALPMTAYLEGKRRGRQGGRGDRPLCSDIDEPSRLISAAC